MKTKKSRREASASTDCSSSSTDSSSKAPTASNKQKDTNVKSTAKTASKRQHTPERDCKSKWDSPDDRIHLKHSDKDKPAAMNSSSSKNNDDRDTSRSKGKEGSHKEVENSRHRDHRRDREHRTSSSRHQKHSNQQEGERYRPSSKDSRSNRREGSLSRSRSPKHRTRERRHRRSRSKSFDHSKAVWGKSEHNKKNLDPPKEKEKPNFGLSGKLTEETNTYKGVVIKYSEPPEARKPKRRWRLYPFKGEKAMQTLYIHRESAYLIGRERSIVDLAVDHPSCSKQHAVLQYRLVPFTRPDGSAGKRVRPYLIDLESANGTYINNKKIDPKKYVELLERDVIKFGYSSREYVVLHENSKDEAQDDDVNDDEEVVKDAPVKVETA